MEITDIWLLLGPMTSSAARGAWLGRSPVIGDRATVAIVCGLTARSTAEYCVPFYGHGALPASNLRLPSLLRWTCRDISEKFNSICQTKLEI